MSHVYGIDIGTKYARIAKIDTDGKAVIIQDYENCLNEIAAVVHILSDGSIMVGDAAKEEGFFDSQRTFQDFTRHMGDSAVSVQYSVDGREFDPIELYAMVLHRMIDYAKMSGEVVKDAVLTCPAYFSHAQREAIKNAGEIIGLNVRGIVNEPVAAVMGYFPTERFKEEVILVFDLGGTTLDISLLRMNHEGEIDFLGFTDSVLLGGKEWDNKLYQLLQGQLEHEYGILVDEQPEDFKNTLLSTIEDLKKKLSIKLNAKARFPYEGEKYTLNVTREDFEAISTDLTHQANEYLNSVLQSSSFTDCDVDFVLMVGGATKMPMILNMLRERFGEKVVWADPNLAIAKGAAIAAKKYSRNGIPGHLQQIPIIHPNRISAKEMLEKHLREGSARIVYDRTKDKVKVVYSDEKPDNPLIAQIIEDVRFSLNSIYENHIRIEKIRQNVNGLFFDSQRAEEMSKELTTLIANQNHIKELIDSFDHWSMIVSLLSRAEE